MSSNSTRASLRALCLAAAIAPFAIWPPTPASADETFSRITTIQIPGKPLTAFDISWIDQLGERYILADRSNAALDVVSTDTNALLFQVPGFVGPSTSNDTAGPDGVLTIHHSEAWAGDGDSTVKVVDLTTKTITDTISTGGTKRADELCYDARNHEIMIANDADTPPFVTFISTDTHKVLGKISFPQATNGLEQCQWSPRTGLIYFSVPQLNGNAGHGEVAVIDGKTMSVVDAFPMTCEPAGLALGPDFQALVGCNDTHGIRVINLKDGSVVKVYAANGADEVWYNPGDDHYFAALSNNTGPGGPILAVIDAESARRDQSVTGGTGDHSVAADPNTNRVYFPRRPVPTDPACQNGCIDVLGPNGKPDLGTDPKNPLLALLNPLQH